MDAVGLSLGVVSTVFQTYSAVMSVYDLYLGVTDFPNTYQYLRMGLLIERQRLKIWGDHALPLYEKNSGILPRGEQGLFEVIFNHMRKAFADSQNTMNIIGQRTGLPIQNDSEGKSRVNCDTDMPCSNRLPDYEFIRDLSILDKAPPKNAFTSLSRRIKFELRDKKRIEDLIKQLCYWNDSLDKMTSGLEQDAQRRRLRTHFSTGDTTQLQHVEAAAAMLNHRDIQQMARVRLVIEQEYVIESSPILSPRKAMAPALASPGVIEGPQTPNYRLEMAQLNWVGGNPFATDKTRATAIFQEREVIVDWRSCQDDSWRRENPAAFHQRTMNLTKILNSDLRPLNLAVLHCIGYLDKTKHCTGYAFDIPTHAEPNQKHVTLHDLLVRRPRPEDVPDLGERFELAKALVSTVFEIHNLGWMHKNIQPRNILFWPKRDAKSEPDLSKPYLMGFDISRPNQPGEKSEKPDPNPVDDHYRHPDYTEWNSRSFQPSFDIWSLGVVLYEIAVWQNAAVQSHKHSASSNPPLLTHSSDPHLIAKMVEKGSLSNLKRFTGGRYQDAVKACLSREFDRFWEDNGANSQKRLQLYLEELQKKVVEAIAVCNA